MQAQTLQIQLPENLETDFELVFFRRHTCSGRSGRKIFKLLVNPEKGEVRFATDILPVTKKTYGSRCSGHLELYTNVEHYVEAAKRGYILVKEVVYRWDAGRTMVDTAYYLLSVDGNRLAVEAVEHEAKREFETKEWYDLVKVDGRILKVYRSRVEVAETG